MYHPDPKNLVYGQMWAFYEAVRLWVLLGFLAISDLKRFDPHFFAGAIVFSVGIML
jgi:hypothetical protein